MYNFNKIKKMKNIDLVNIGNDNEVVEGTEEMKYENIADSPFTAVKKGDSKWLLVMGDNLVTRKTTETFEEMEEWVNSKPWELIVVSSKVFNDKIKEKNDEK